MKNLLPFSVSFSARRVLLAKFTIAIAFFPFIVFGQLPTSFQKVDLITGLKNVINFEFAPDGRAFIIDRYGQVIVYNPQTQISKTAGTLSVYHDMEDGLLAIAFDPQFLTNKYVYIHYCPAAVSTHRVSRFTVNGDVLDLASEVVMLEWPWDRNGYFHAAGDMDFDSNGNLYIAVGDNTDHSQYATLNETNSNQSSERTSSNTNDLRGKILRIKPQSNGTYTIPQGNLFPNGEGGRPEIYVMGARNPFKIYLDKTNNWLYWGEVGPDANFESNKGPEGMDEINLTKSAGNYGWPYFSGKNEPYLNGYATPNFYYDPASPVNLSKWNNGAKVLPPAQPAWLDFFHECYLAGPKYYFNPAINNPKKLPSDFDKTFFYYDFNTSKVWAAKTDAAGNILSTQQLAPDVVKGAGFIDLKIGPDGQLYILEYGAGCCPENVGSGKLVRLDYTGIDPNKSPVVNISADKTYGPLPLTVSFSSAGTVDPNNDPLTYEWDFQSDGTVDSNAENPTFTYTQRGTFNALLRVKDGQGGITAKSVQIGAGNNAATFTFNSPLDGGMMSWEDNINYNITVNDAEDGSTSNGTISCSAVNLVPAMGHLSHSHDGITIKQCSGTFYLDPTSHDTQGQDHIYYLFKVNYTDKDGLTAFDQAIVYPKLMEAEFYDQQSNTQKMDNNDNLGGGRYSVRALTHDSYITLNGRNLHNISSVSYRVASTVGAVIEIHADSPTGPLVSKVTVPVTGSMNNWANASGSVTNPGGKHDLYFVFKKSGGANFLDLNYIEFKGSGVSVNATPPNVYSVQAQSQSQVSIKFNEPVDKITAETAANYSINNNISVISAALQGDRKTVILNTSKILLQVENELTVRNVKNENGIALTQNIVKNFTLEEVLVRVNAGGPQVELNGVLWKQNQYNSGGTSYSNTSIPIGNTTSDAIYQTELNGNFTYNIPVPQKGIYNVNLHFAELFFKVTGGRVFNVNIENGQYSLVNYDIFARAGYANALMENFYGVRVEDGFLTITTSSVKNTPKISAIEVFYGQETMQEPSISIINPSNAQTVAQPFKVTYDVNYWPVASGSSHIHKIVDGVDKGDVTSSTNVSFTGLSVGSHTIQLVLANADHSLTDFKDQVQVNVVAELACEDNPFPVNWTEKRLGSQVAHRSVWVFAADINGDGHKDIVTGAWWYRNPGSPTGTWTQNIIGAPMNNMSRIHDFDKDGDLDIFGTQGTYVSAKMAWAENDGKGNFIIHTNIPDGTSTYAETFMAGAAIGNFNGVANTQIAIIWNGGENGSSAVQMLTVPADPVNQPWEIRDISPKSFGEAITAGDIDKDGDLDLFQGGNWLRNDNGTWATIPTGLKLPSKFDRSTLADIDRDGILDAVVTQIGIDQYVSLFQAQADPTLAWTNKTIGTDVDSGISLDVADMDGDGDLDVLTGEWKEAHRLIAFENDLCNTGTWIKHILHAGGTTAPDHHDGTQAVDIDDDGDLDIISMGWDQRIPRIYINNGNATTNNPPVVATPIPDQSTTPGVNYSYAFPSTTFSDPEGNPLTYTATLADGTALPSWLSFTSSTRTFSGTTPATPAIFTVKVTANDGKGGTVSDEFSFSTGTGGPPVVSAPIADQTVTAGTSFSFAFPQNTFTDPDNNPLSYTATLSNGSALPAWLNFSSATRTFSGTPPVDGPASLTIRVTANDGTGWSVYDDFVLNLQGTVEVYRINSGGALLTNSIGVFAADNSFSGGKTYANTRITNIAGTTDDEMYKTERSGDLANFSYNIPVSSGTYLLKLHFAEIYYGATGGGAGNTGLRVFNVTAEGQTLLTNYDIYAEVGSMTAAVKQYTVTVTDGVLNVTFVRVLGNPKVSAIEVIKSDGSNRQPVVSTPIPNQTATAGTAFSYAFPTNTFTDPDNDALSYTASLSTGGALPSWLNFSAATRTFSGTPPADASSLVVKVTASDGKGGTAADEFSITISTGSSNGAPVVATSIPDQSATVGTAFSYAFPAGTFSDPDNDPLTYTASLSTGSALPSWLNFSAATRTFSGTPPTGAPSSLTLKVTASDGKGGTVADEFVIAINAGNRAPVVSAPIPDQTAPTGAAFSYTFPAGTFSDPDNDALTYTATLATGGALPGWLNFNAATRTFSGTPATTDAGALEIRVTASDNALSVSDQFMLTVVDNSTFAVRINAGGPQLTAAGVVFAADNSFAGGKTYTNTKIANVAGTNDDELYRTERSGSNANFSYNIAVPSGSYLLKLHFAEIYHGATGGGAGGVGSRVFSVTGEGQPLLTNYDIFAEVGTMTAVVKQFPVNVTDGTLNVVFVRVAGNPKVSAIEVVATSQVGRPPVVSTPIPDQTATAGTAFSYAFPTNTFSDPDNDPLTYTASLANGAALPLWLNFSPATRTFSGTPPADALSNLTIKVTANDGTGLTVSDEFVLTLQGTVEVHRINAGGPQVSTSLGVFLADARFSGGTAKSYTKEIANTTNDVLYQSERYGAFSYNIPVSNGQYNVVLHFAENYYTAAGKRVFDVSIEGVKVLANYDIFSKVGLNTATTETFVATVGDGTLNINFTKILDNAKVSAIEVIKVSSTSTAARSSFEAKATDVLVNYYPNPFTRTFTLKIHRKGQDKLPLKIYNAFGREVMQLENLLPEQTVTMGGEFSPGVYILMVGTGDQARWYKVVKAK